MTAAATVARAQIREATDADVPAIAERAMVFNATTPYRSLIAFDRDRVADSARQIIQGELGAIWLAEREDRLIGMLAAIVSQHPLSGEWIATEVVWWIDPRERGGRAALQLLRRTEAWARTKGATVFQMIAPDARTANFYERLDFVSVETLYQRRIA